MYGVGSCASARRDHQAARLSFENEQQTAHQRDHRVRNWMRAAPQHTYSPYPATAGEYYRGSRGGVGAGGRMAERSSGGGFDVGGDQQRQVQLMAPELRSSLSPSPRKASCKSKEDWPSATAAADSRLVSGCGLTEMRRKTWWQQQDAQMRARAAVHCSVHAVIPLSVNTS